jgi:hypothetical protein
MPKNSPKKIVRKLIERFGYDIKLNRIATSAIDNKNLAFLHIAKCGGVSIDSALRQQFALSGQPKLNRAAAIKTTLSGFSQEVESPENSARFADLHVNTLNTLMSYHLGLNWRYVSGHANINSQQLSQFKEQYDFITVLRDPIKRFISHYIFTKLTNELSVMLPNKFCTDNLVQEAKEIIASRRGWHMMNTPTMCLTGRYPEDHNDAKAMQLTVAANLSQFSVVGFLTHLEQFTTQIKDVTGKSIDISHRNASNVFISEQQLKVRTTLQEFFSDKSTQLTLAKLGESERINYNQAQALYIK